MTMPLSPELVRLVGTLDQSKADVDEFLRDPDVLRIMTALICRPGLTVQQERIDAAVRKLAIIALLDSALRNCERLAEQPREDNHA